MDVITIVDDLTGKPGAERINFSWGGQELEIDLAPANKRKFEKIFSDIIPHARRAGQVKTQRTATGEPRRSITKRRADADMRSWCQANGHQVADRGRIPATAQEAYRAYQREKGRTKPTPPPLVLTAPE